MALNVEKEVAALRRMTTGELHANYRQVFGEEPRSRHKQWLVKRIAWRIQANAEGDLSERARRRAEELANDADLRCRPPVGHTATTPFITDDRLPMPGVMLTRQYRGRRIEVLVLPKGFEFDGRIYRSLSAVAKAVTGAHWNGYHFFGLQGKGSHV